MKNDFKLHFSAAAQPKLKSESKCSSGPFCSADPDELSVLSLVLAESGEEEELSVVAVPLPI